MSHFNSHSLSLHLHLSHNLSLCVTIFPSSSPSRFRCKNMSNVSSWKYEHVYDLRKANGIFLIMFQVEVKVVPILCLHQKYILYLNNYPYSVCHEIWKGCIVACASLPKENQHNNSKNLRPRSFDYKVWKISLWFANEFFWKN